MEQLYEDTLKKVNYLKDRGFEVEEKWGCEFKKELKQDEEMKQFMEDSELVDPLHPRDAFFGGRTNAAKLLRVSGRRENQVSLNTLPQSRI